jgi:hypothetical protein
MRVIVKQLVERTTIAGETEELGENLPQRHFVPPQIPHDQVRFRTPHRSGGKPATNRLSYGAARCIYLLLRSKGLRYSSTMLLLWRSGFDPTSGHVGFVVDKIVLGRVCSENFRLSCQFSFHQLLHVH